MQMDSRLHSRKCTKKYADTSFGIQNDKIDYLGKTEDKDEDDFDDEIKEKDIRLDSLEDSQKIDSSQSSTKQEFKHESDHQSDMSDEEPTKESINSKKIKLSNLKDEDDLLFDGKEEVYQKKEKGSKKLNELLELEDESADSQVEEPREEEDVEPLPEVMEAIDHEEEAKKFFNQPIFDDLDSQSSNSDAENKRDPLFVEEIEIE